jgi:hypothetical protein
MSVWPDSGAIGMFAIRDDRDYIVQDDMMKAVRKVAESKKHEGKLVSPPCVLKRGKVDWLNRTMRLFNQGTSIEGGG